MASFTIKYLNNCWGYQLSLLELILDTYDDFCVTKIKYNMYNVHNTELYVRVHILYV